jgi:hypothetical protein
MRQLPSIDPENLDTLADHALGPAGSQREHAAGVLRDLLRSGDQPLTRAQAHRLAQAPDARRTAPGGPPEPDALPWLAHCRPDTLPPDARAALANALHGRDLSGWMHVPAVIASSRDSRFLADVVRRTDDAPLAAVALANPHCPAAAVRHVLDREGPRGYRGNRRYVDALNSPAVDADLLRLSNRHNAGPVRDAAWMARLARHPHCPADVLDDIAALEPERWTPELLTAVARHPKSGPEALAAALHAARTSIIGPVFARDAGLAIHDREDLPAALRDEAMAVAALAVMERPSLTLRPAPAAPTAPAVTATPAITRRIVYDAPTRQVRDIALTLARQGFRGTVDELLATSGLLSG